MLLLGAFALQSFLLCIERSEHPLAQKVVENFAALMCMYRSSRTEKSLFNLPNTIFILKS